MRLRKYHLFPMLLSLCVSAFCCFVTGAGASPVPVLPGTPAGIISTPGDYGTEQEDTNATPGSYPETETGEEMALEEQGVPDDLISDLPLTLLKAPILKATPDVLTYESLTASAAR